jgi:toxin ParE1/3/4
MKVRYTARARDDLSSILDYLDEHSRQGARNVKRGMDKAFALIGRHPQIGRLSKVQETRVLPVGRYPYLIYWSIEPEKRGSSTSAMRAGARGWMKSPNSQTDNAVPRLNFR